MGVAVRRGPSLLATTVPILIMLLLLHAHICRAVSPVRANSSTSGCCNGDQEEGLVGDIASSLEEEFLMGSEISRRILGSIQVTANTGSAGKLAAKACGKFGDYRTCLPRGNNGVKHPQKCDPYNRICN